MQSSLSWLLGVFALINIVYSLPIDDNTIDYLRIYGYLPQPTSNTRFGDELMHENVASDALKALQKIANIEETGVLDDATKKLLRQPRCGNPDFEIINNGAKRHRRYALGPSKWQKLHLTWKFMNKNHPKSIYEEGQIRRLITEALEVWQSNSNLKITETADNDADIIIDFARLNHGDNFNFEGQGGALAHAFYPGTALGGDVHLDDDESWDIEFGDGNDIGDVNLFYTLLHELGHSLGLAHSSRKESVMFPWYSRQHTFDRETKTLPEDDVIAIEQLYGSKPGRKWGPIYNPKTTRRIQTRPTTTPRIDESSTTTSRPETPDDSCNMKYDAIGIVRNELMIFRGKWMWRLRDGKLIDGYPAEFSRMWRELAPYDHIDAVFERQDGKFVFFIGREVIVIDSYQKSYTHDLEYLGLDRKIQKIDAIFRWGYNNKTFVFSGDQYWKVDDNLHVVKDEPNSYPRKIAYNWKNVNKIKIDTAFQTEGVTYFFDDKVFYQFNDQRMSLMIKKPQVSSIRWMNCRLTEEQITDIQKSARTQEMETSSAPTTSPKTSKHFVTKKTFIGIIHFQEDDAKIFEEFDTSTLEMTEMSTTTSETTSKTTTEMDSRIYFKDEFDD